MAPIVNYQPLSSPPLQQAGAWPAEDSVKEATKEATREHAKHFTPKDSLGNTQVFQGGELDRLFKTIDQLRECGVSEDISLPQLVVVGDQSSGKSSVLEALTQIPFPIASTLCTRYATQINFRRAVDERIVVTIVPSKHSESGRANLLRKFSRTPKHLTPESFAEILAEASEAMGLPRPGQECPVGSEARFSDDVLRIELCGPSRLHFSVVDVPGLFHCATAHQTEEDALIVENMVKGYIGESRTIILAVASAINETANQQVFRLAKEADPKGLRTVGLLTKPDAVQAGDEDRVIDVALNRVTHLNHGWFLVRNRSTDDVKKGVTLEGRLHNERAFFQTVPWRSLDKDRVGIQSLEVFLRKLLHNHVRKEYPILVKELERKVAVVRDRVKNLGPPRETPDQQRLVIIEVATRFQHAARDALMGFYRLMLKDKDLRLRTSIRALNDDFANEVKTEGHVFDFSATDEENVAKISAWILGVHRESRGIELEGLVNYEVFRSLFHEQTAKWEKIAMDHVSAVHLKVNEFVQRLMELQCPDADLCSKLGTYLSPYFDETLDSAIEELEKILLVERGEFMLTYDDGFVASLEAIRMERMVGGITANSAGRGSVIKDGVEMWSWETVKSSIQDCYRTRQEQGVLEIYDYLKSYYKAARTRFIDCVCLQVVERHFLGIGGTVQIFSPALVARMSSETLQTLAGEELTVVNERRRLTERLERLEKARRIATSGWR